MDLTIPTILYLLSHAILNDFPPFMDYHLTGEIEEQLHILEDLSPDWISKKVIPGGDILYSIKEIADQKSVRARLVEVI
jgi:hypothetical protein